MFSIVHGSTHGLPDAEAFVESLDAGAGAFFDEGAEIFVARAPGRLDVMGGIADYSGSLVLQLPLREAAFVALQRDDSRALRIVSLRRERGGERADSFEMPLADFDEGGAASDYAAARAYFRRDPSRHWASYVAGVLLVLKRERGARLEGGARVLVSSSVPEGKGVSSSAAVEVATATAAAAAFRVDLPPREAALLCQRAENLVAGAPCGVMDQMTAACGEAGRLLALLCQPAELLEGVAVPEGLSFWGLDSGVRHAVAGADYGAVRAAAFMGYRIVAELAGLDVRGEGGRVRVEDPRWGGRLANLSPSEFEQRYARRLPATMTGGEFLSRYGGITDDVTRVEPGRAYPVRAAARHPVHEHFRVRAFAELLKGDAAGPRPELLGELMFQSHASYTACGLGSEGTDLLVGLAREGGRGRGLYGAKITGGGGGGTVAVLGDAGAGAAVSEVAARYAAATGYDPQVFAASSPGAARFGVLKLRGRAG